MGTRGAHQRYLLSVGASGASGDRNETDLSLAAGCPGLQQAQGD